MALEVTVGPPVLTINNGHTFMLTQIVITENKLIVLP
jgi:hypothetical protein